MTALTDILSRPRVTVIVRPGARKTRVAKIAEETIHLDVAAPPEDGKANREVARYLAKLSGKKAVIATGATSKVKTVRLD